ncbi:hypothetical protein M4951_18305 [Blastopirellula sp. J2-11]|uniref:hypothetical protein n=1 Tax=Blastopirellula sp. J2-11 TaxID=2943192 RepID=UPI0021CA5CC6|nr:hypothetical protein [Blastopirellula sp. J2-11]UUO05321.1 hypothetical protein M4951_18305 [Blastopirellula sp. J2-11]
MIFELISSQVVRLSIGEVYEYWKNRLFPKPKTASEIVFERIQHLYEAHRLSGISLLQHVPSHWNWTVETVGSPERLAAALHTEQLEWIAETFRINRGWLDGSDETILSPMHGYKYLALLKRTLEEQGWLDGALEVSILAANYQGGYGGLGWYAIVFSHPVARPHGDVPQIYQSALLETQWNWGHWPSERDTLAIARWYSMEINRYAQIPIVPICDKDFEDIVELRKHPGCFLPVGPGGYECLEDRVLKSSESTRAVQPECVDSILSYLAESGLLDEASELKVR